MPASTILDGSPIPNQMMNSGASAIRGMPLSASMKGSTTLPTNANRASSTPVIMPEHGAAGITDEGLAQRDDEVREQIVLHPHHEVAGDPQRAREP